MSRRASGLRAWLLQRISAIYIALFGLFFLLTMLFAAPESYQDWQRWIARPLISLTMVIFFIALATHAWVGIRDVIIDYVNALSIRLLLLSLVGVILLGSLSAAIMALLSVR